VAAVVRRNREWLKDMRWAWSLGGLSAAELGRRLWMEIENDDVLGRAAQLSFYFLLALFPLLIFLSALFGYAFAGNSELYNRLLGHLASVMPKSAYQLVRATMDEITAGSSGHKLSFGFAAALWTASSGMDAIINGLNIAYNVRELRPWWKRRLVALNLTVLLALMTLAALGLMLAGGSIGRWVAGRFHFGEFFERLWAITQVGIPFLFMLLVFAIIYRFAPNIRDYGWQGLMPGTLFAVVCWLLATGAFRLYLAYFDNYNRTYGSLGAVIVLLLWLYVTGLAILLGGEVNSEIRRAAAAAGAKEAQKPIEAPE
jgi:membrane protein